MKSMNNDQFIDDFLDKGSLCPAFDNNIMKSLKRYGISLYLSGLIIKNHTIMNEYIKIMRREI